MYVASPLGFSEAGREFYYRRLLPALRRDGHHVVDPWKLAEADALERARKRPYGRARRDALGELNAAAARANQAAIDGADAVVAVLDGADVDSGTAAEIGYAFARGKPIVGYRGDGRLAGDNEGALVNLQVEYFIRAGGGALVLRLADVRRALAGIAGHVGDAPSPPPRRAGVSPLRRIR